MNKFMVGAAGDDVAILALGRKLTKSDALNLAAWLVAIADPSFCVVGEPVTEFGKAVLETHS